MVAALISDTKVIVLQTEGSTKPASGTGSVSVGSKRVQCRIDREGFSHLTCECADFLRLMWCEHVQILYMDKERNTAGLFTPAMGIVVFARKPTLVIPVIALDSEEVRGLIEVKAVWGNPRRESNDTVSFDGSEVVGYLDTKKNHRGEIRMMLLEWLPAVADVYTKDMECEDSGHLVSAISDDVKMIYADAYCLLDSQRCYNCRQNLLSD